MVVIPDLIFEIGQTFLDGIGLVRRGRGVLIEMIVMHRDDRTGLSGKTVTQGCGNGQTDDRSGAL
ncbi:MAG: hypothetical protein OEY21_01930 [Nitrospira sp.]|nr:hypothetical protein [Nitrospira sp.]